MEEDVCRGCCLYSYIVGNPSQQNPEIIHAEDCMKEVFRMNEETKKGDDGNNNLPKPSNVEEYGYFDLNNDTMEKEPTLLTYISQPQKMEHIEEEEESQQYRPQGNLSKKVKSCYSQMHISDGINSLSITSTPCPSSEMPDEEQSFDQSSHDQTSCQVGNRTVLDNASTGCRIIRLIDLVLLLCLSWKWEEFFL